MAPLLSDRFLPKNLSSRQRLSVHWGHWRPNCKMDETLISVCLSSDHTNQWIRKINRTAVRQWLTQSERHCLALAARRPRPLAARRAASEMMMTCRQKDVAYWFLKMLRVQTAQQVFFSFFALLGVKTKETSLLKFAFQWGAKTIG